MKQRLVLIEFTQDTETRSSGTQLRVDAMSAKSLVDVKKVAKLVGSGEEKAEAREAVKAVPKPEGDK